jgi:hypothetical protein
LTINYKFVSFILNRAYPPVNFVANGESVVFKVNIYIEGEGLGLGWGALSRGRIGVGIGRVW